MGLYEESEKPGDALSFLQNFLQGSGPGSADIEDLKAENLELKAKNEAVSVLIWLAPLPHRSLFVKLCIARTPLR